MSSPAGCVGVVGIAQRAAQAERTMPAVQVQLGQSVIQGASLSLFLSLASWCVTEVQQLAKELLCATADTQTRARETRTEGKFNNTEEHCG